MSINYENVIYIVGNFQSCFAFGIDKQVIEMKSSLYHLQQALKEQGFMPVNGFTIINTKYFLSKKDKRLISLKGGSIHKVSRKLWNHF